MRDPDTTAVLDSLRECYGQGAWAARLSDGSCGCGDGLNASGYGATWDLALTALINSRCLALADKAESQTSARARAWTEVEWIRCLISASLYKGRASW